MHDENCIENKNKLQTINMALHEKVALIFFHFRFLDGVNLECVRLVWGVSCSWDAIGNVVS